MIHCDWGGIKMPVEECPARNCIQVTQVPTCFWNRWGELSVQGTKYQEAVEVIEISVLLLGNRTAALGKVESSPSRHEVGMTHQPHCLCMNGAVLEAGAKLGHPHKRGSLEHIKIQGHGGRKERIQRSPVHCPHAASAPSTGRLGRQGNTPNSVRLLPGYSSQSVQFWALHPVPWTANTDCTKAGERKRKSSAILCISVPELYSTLRKRRDQLLQFQKRELSPLMEGRDSILCAHRLDCYSASSVLLTIAENAHLLRATPSNAVWELN